MNLIRIIQVLMRVFCSYIHFLWDVKGKRDINTNANVRVQLDMNRLYTAFPQPERFNMELTSYDDLLLLIDRL